MKYYKVVAECDVGLYSVTVDPCSPYRQRVIYRFNQWVEAPENTRLFVFDNFNAAKDFAKNYDNSAIYECSCIGVSKGYPCDKSSSIKYFWNQIFQIKNKKKKVNWNTIPRIRKELPSILAKKVKLLRKIDV